MSLICNNIKKTIPFRSGLLGMKWDQDKTRSQIGVLQIGNKKKKKMKKGWIANCNNGVGGRGKERRGEEGRADSVLLFGYFWE